MTSFDPTEFMSKAASIAVTNSRTKRTERTQFCELIYTERLKLIVQCTRDTGRIMGGEMFNDLVNGMKTIQEVCNALGKWHAEVPARRLPDEVLRLL